jgi:hypothetical protein
LKKIFTLLFSSLIVLLLFAAPGNSVMAAEECSCHELGPIYGVERNQIVANLLKTDSFKNVKQKQENNGYVWNGADTIQVIKPGDGTIMVGVPFVGQNGSVVFSVFIDGQFAGNVPN